MALPHLIKYVYTNGTDEVIRRGKKIHAIGYVELIEYDELFETVTFRIRFLFRNSVTQSLFPFVAAALIIWEISAATKQPR
jgi:hypothetical protein